MAGGPGRSDAADRRAERTHPGGPRSVAGGRGRAAPSPPRAGENRGPAAAPRRAGRPARTARCCAPPGRRAAAGLSRRRRSPDRPRSRWPASAFASRAEPGTPPPAPRRQSRSPPSDRSAAIRRCGSRSTVPSTRAMKRQRPIPIGVSNVAAAQIGIRRPSTTARRRSAASPRRARSSAAAAAATSATPPSATAPCTLAHSTNSGGSQRVRSRASSVTSTDSRSRLTICGRSAQTTAAGGSASSVSTKRVAVAPTDSR